MCVSYLCDGRKRMSIVPIVFRFRSFVSIDSQKLCLGSSNTILLALYLRLSQRKKLEVLPTNIEMWHIGSEQSLKLPYFMSLVCPTEVYVDRVLAVLGMIWFSESLRWILMHCKFHKIHTIALNALVCVESSRASNAYKTQC